MLFGAADLANPAVALRLTDYYSIQHHVTASFPPTFLFHSKEDEVVPVIGTIRMNQSLAEAQVGRVGYVCMYVCMHVCM